MKKVRNTICLKCKKICYETDHYNMTTTVPIYECKRCNEFYCWLGGKLITTFKPEELNELPI